MNFNSKTKWLLWFFVGGFSNPVRADVKILDVPPHSLNRPVRPIEVETARQQQASNDSVSANNTVENQGNLRSSDAQEKLKPVDGRNENDPGSELDLVATTVTESAPSQSETNPVLPRSGNDGESSDSNAPAKKESVHLDRITVVGEKTPRSLQETVSSVSVITAENIEDSLLFDLNNVYNRVVNVSQAFGGEGFSIRGINFSTIAGGNTTGSNLGSLYIDGAFISGFGISLGQDQLWDVEQVEVFRGAQSTNQGRNALAGAVNIRTKSPTFDWTADSRLLYNDLESYRSSIAFGGPVIEDILAFRIAADYVKTDGFIENPTRNDNAYGGGRDSMIRGKLLFRPTAEDDFSALFTFSRSENKSGDDVVAIFDPSGNPISPFERKIFSNVEGFENVDQDILSLNMAYPINSAFRLESVTSYNRTRYERQDDDDQGATGEQNRRLRDETSNVFTQELRFHLDHGGWRGHVGGYYFRQTRDNESDFIGSVDVNDFVGPALARFYQNPFPTSRVADFDVTINNWAVFGELEYSFNEYLTVYGGIRYDNEIQDFTNHQQLSLLAPLADPATIPFPFNAFASFFNNSLDPFLEPTDLDSRAEFSALLPKGGFTVNWTENFSTSLTYQRGYRAGGNDLVVGPPNVYAPEFTDNYEFALRSLWFDERLSLNANLFYIDWKDQQVLVPQNIPNTPPGSIFHTENAGQSELYGFELEMNGRPLSGLDLYAGVGFVHSKFKEFETANLDLSGNIFTNSPKWTASGGFFKRWQDGWLKNFFLGADVTYQDRSFDDPANTLINDARTILNARLGYENDHFSAMVFSQNIFDAEYVTRRLIRTNSVKVGPPRVVGVQLTAHWW